MKHNPNRELNKEHERRTAERVRPKQPTYEFAELEKVVNAWVRERLNNRDE